MSVTETDLDDNLTLVSSLVRPLDVLQLESVGGAGRVVPHGEPVVPDDQGGAGGERDRFALLVNLHPEDRVLRGPEDAALHVYGGGPRGGDVGCDVGDGGSPLTRHNTKTQILQSHQSPRQPAQTASDHHLEIEITMASINIIVLVCSSSSS